MNLFILGGGLMAVLYGGSAAALGLGGIALISETIWMVLRRRWQKWLAMRLLFTAVVIYVVSLALRFRGTFDNRLVTALWIGIVANLFTSVLFCLGYLVVWQRKRRWRLWQQLRAESAQHNRAG